MSNNNGNQNPEPNPQSVLEIKILNNTVSISGFPPNLFQSLDILAVAQKAILSYFSTQAKEGNLDNNLSIVTPPIVTQDKKLVDPAGKPVLQ